MIDNTAYAAWRVKQGVPCTEKTWARWMAAEQARPVAGAVEGCEACECEWLHDVLYHEPRCEII